MHVTKQEEEEMGFKKQALQHGRKGIPRMVIKEIEDEHREANLRADRPGCSERLEGTRRDNGCLHTKRDKTERLVDESEYIERRFILLVKCLGIH